MTILEIVIIGVAAVLICLNVALLAAAAVVFLFDITARIRQWKIAPRRFAPGHARLDLWT